MSLLKNFPLVTQQTKISADGTSPNASNDCVPASIGAAILWYQGKTQWDNEINPDKLLDMAYPEGYQGGTAAIKFVDACKSFGIRLSPVQGDNEGLVKEAHGHLAEGVPVIFTIVDPYMPASSGFTHVCVWYADGPGTLTAMDPWPGKPVTHSDAEWVAAMRFNEIWLAEKIVQPVSGIPANWHDDGTTLTAPNGVAVVRGFRAHVLANHWHPDNWPLAPEFGTDSLEGSNQTLGKGTQQVFRWSMLGWTAKNGVFEEWVGQELVYARNLANQNYQQVMKYYNLSKQLHDTAVAVQADNVKLATDNAQLQADVLTLQQGLPK